MFAQVELGAERKVDAHFGQNPFNAAILHNFYDATKLIQYSKRTAGNAGTVAGTVPAVQGGKTSMNSPLCYSIAEACSAVRAGRTTLFEAIRSGALRAVKRGRRTIVLADDLRHYLESLPAVAPNERHEHIRSACDGATRTRP
jgi:excisionase family DNA binding protein